jgi:peptidoglycan/xylan/chitin deacetylase (PgdA/CDA1 family)
MVLFGGASEVTRDKSCRDEIERKCLRTPPSSYVQFQSLADTWSEGLLVLMYHSVGVPPLLHGLRGLYVTPQHLARQLREMQGASAVRFTTLGEWNRMRPTGRQVAITFDDAYRNLFTNGLPVLQETGVRAITYVVAALIGKSNQWDDHLRARHEPLMDRVQLMEWLQAGHEIGSHGMKHRFLASLSLNDARREIIDSKKLLEDTFGQLVRHFCYPYGDLNDAIRDMVHEAGYETATSTLTGFNTATTDAFVLRRILARHQRPWLTALDLPYLSR